MTRIATCLAERGRRKLLVPFLTFGYPTVSHSVDLIRSAADVGADMIEIGVPFSDPLADGPAIQYSSHIALQNKVSLRQIIDAVADLRKQISLPIILMGYFNPILTFGLDRLARVGAVAGVDGLIIPDLPIEEGRGLKSALEAEGLSAVFLVAPTSPRERVASVDAQATDFVYAVTVAGVTGARGKVTRDTRDYLQGLRRQLTKPFVAGFGISSPETAAMMARDADGVVIGSRLIELIRDARTSAAGRRNVSRLLASLRTALDRVAG